MRAGQGQAEGIEITVAPHGGMRARCSVCQKPAPGYDRLPERHWQFVPLWGIVCYMKSVYPSGRFDAVGLFTPLTQKVISNLRG